MIKIIDLLKKRIDFSPQEMRYKSSKFWGRTLIWTIIGSFGVSFVYACFAILPRYKVYILPMQIILSLNFFQYIYYKLIKKN